MEREQKKRNISVKKCPPYSSSRSNTHIDICLHAYLDVGGEEGELQRPSVLHAAGDHACEEQPHHANLRLLVAAAATPAGRYLHAISSHVSTGEVA